MASLSAPSAQRMTHPCQPRQKGGEEEKRSQFFPEIYNVNIMESSTKVTECPLCILFS